MLEYKQLPPSDGPADIEVSTDDGGAELLALTEALEEEEYEGQTVANLKEATRGEDGLWRFVIPGAEAMDVADLLEDRDDLPSLGDFLEEANKRMLRGTSEG